MATNIEGTPKDMAQDRAGAKAKGMTMEQYEGSADDTRKDAARQPHPHHPGRDTKGAFMLGSGFKPGRGAAYPAYEGKRADVPGSRFYGAQESN